MDADTFILKLEAMNRDIVNESKDISRRIALNAKEAIERRILSEGINGAEYSTAYEKIRGARGKQTDHVDLSFNNTMWANITAKNVSGDSKKNSVTVGATNSREEQKVKDNVERYGGFLEVTEKEANDLKKDAQDEIKRIANRYFS